MKRALGLILLALLGTGTAKDPSVPKDLLNATWVYVGAFPDVAGVSASRRGVDAVSPADDQAIRAVQAAIRNWGRWHVANTMDQADLVIVVQTHHANFGRSGIPIPGAPTMGPTIAIGGGSDAPHEDTIEVFSAYNNPRLGGAANDEQVGAKPLWRLEAANALGPGVPGIQQLRRDVERGKK